MITILELVCCRASSNQLVRWSKVWRLFRRRRRRDKQIFALRHLTEWCHRREGHRLHPDSIIEWSNGSFLDRPNRPRRQGSKERRENNWRYPRFGVWLVCRQWWSFGAQIPRLRTTYERTRLRRRSVRSYQWLNHERVEIVCRWIEATNKIYQHLNEQWNACMRVEEEEESINEPVSPMMMYLKRYA